MHKLRGVFAHMQRIFSKVCALAGVEERFQYLHLQYIKYTRLCNILLPFIAYLGSRSATVLLRDHAAFAAMMQRKILIRLILIGILFAAHLFASPFVECKNGGLILFFGLMILCFVRILALWVHGET